MLCTSAPGARIALSRREEILAAAARLFLEEGYGAASMNRLIARTGGSKATIYALFGNKERLFAAVVGNIVDETEDFISAAEVESLSLRDGLAAIGQKLIETATSSRHIALARLVIAESPRFPEVGRIYHQRTSARFTRLIADFISSHTGAVAAARPTELAEMFTGMLLHHLLFERFCETQAPASPERLRRLTAQAADFIASNLKSVPAQHLSGALT